MKDRGNVAFRTDEEGRRYLARDEGVHAALAGVLIGQSEAMRGVRELILRLAPLDMPVLISGETGTGKELVAEALHRYSGRRGRFVPFNVCAIPDSLFDAAISGHVAGAYTGALRNGDGFLVEATNGTAFLDEISSVPLVAQAKLLRVLDGRRVRPVGGATDRITNCRFVAASNADLDRLAEEREFRTDLLYRLRGAVIHLPPLRERGEDIALLAHWFLELRHECNGRGPRSLTGRAMRVLGRQPWAGNVRELRRTVEFAAALADGGQLEAAHLERAMIGRERIARIRTVHDEKRDALLGTLIRHNGDLGAASRELGVTPKTIYHRLQRSGLSIRALRKAHGWDGENGNGRRLDPPDSQVQDVNSQPPL